MKNYILLFALLVLPITEAASQETEQKLYVPEKGDYSIAVDVTPVLNYVGNIFNGTNNNQIGDISGKPVTSEIEGFNIDNIAPDVSIMGRYMYTDNFAFKANVGLMMRTNTSREYVKDDIASVNDPLTNSKLIDKRNIKRNGLSAMLGCEYRKGSKRLQGVFGAGVILGFNRSATRYNYGNEMTAINQYPTSSWNTYSCFCPSSWDKTCDIDTIFTSSCKDNAIVSYFPKNSNQFLLKTPLVLSLNIEIKT